MANTETLTAGIDVGNDGVKRYLQYSSDFKMGRYDSMTAQYRAGASNVPGQHQIDSSSVLLTTKSSASAELQNRCVAVGSSAKGTGSTSQTLLENKALIAPWLALAAIEPEQETVKSASIHIPTLYLSLPEPNKPVPGRELSGFEYLSRLLVGEHDYTRTNRAFKQDLHVQIDEVVVKSEGEAQFQDCLNNGVFELEKGYIVMVDFGGGTLIISVFSPEGILVQRQVEYRGGIIKLANLIAGEGEMKRTQQGSDDAHLILSGIRNKTFVYGTTGRSFADAYHYHAKNYLSWAGGLVDGFTNFLGIQDETEAVLLVGGGAYIAEQWITPDSGSFFRLAHDPVFGGCRGLVPVQPVAKTRKMAGANA